MADFDPKLHTSQEFDPALHTAAVPETPPGMIKQLGAAALHGAAAEATGTIGKTLGLAASAPFIAADKLRGMVSGQEGTTAQDWAFRNLVDPMVQAGQRFAPTAEESASIPLSVAHGLGGMAVDLPLIAATGGKIGAPEAVMSGARAFTGIERAMHGITAMAPVAMAHGISQASTVANEGVDLPTAFASGAAAGLTTAAMGAVPLAMEGGLATRAITGALSGAAMGEASRQVQNAVLSGHPELQTEFSAKDLAVSAATGALLGSVLGPRAEKASVDRMLREARADVDAGEPLPAEAVRAPEALPAEAVRAPEALPAEAARSPEELPAEAARSPEELPAEAARSPEELPAEIIRSEPVSDRTNTQLQDALMEAQRTQGKDVTRILDQKAIEEAAQKERDLTAIQNITHGEELAAAAERGEVPANAQTLPVSHNDFLDAMKDSKPEDQGMPPRLAQEIAQAVRGLDSYDAQLESLAALRDSKGENSVSYELLSRTYDKLTENRGDAPVAPALVPEALPAEAVRAPEALPAEALPAEAARAPEALPAEAARVPEALPAEAARVPEALPAEAARVPEALPAEAVKAPLARQVQNPESSNPLLSEVLSRTSNIDDVLSHLKENGSAPWVSELAGKLRDMGLKTSIESGAMPEGTHPDTAGVYDTVAKRIIISGNEGGASEHTVLHEIMHAATADRLEQAAQIIRPKNQEEAKLKQAYDNLEKIRIDSLSKGEYHYGLESVHEFMAELHTDPAFQDFLAKKSLWQRTVEGVRRLLGLSADSRTSLEKAMSLQGEFFGKEQYEAAQQARNDTRNFDASPKAAADVTDNLLARVIRTADDDTRHVDWGRINRAVYQKLLPTETVQYIADRVRALPDMVQSGFSAALDGYETAYKTRNIATKYVEENATKFAKSVQDMLYGMKDAAKSRDLNKQMSEIGVGSSIGGFDPTLNFDDNLAQRPGLLASNKAYIDATYRQFKALEASNPTAAKAVVEGAKVNRKGYVMDAATILSNLLDASVGNTRRLESDLQRLAPDDLDRVRAEQNLRAATLDSQLAVEHAPGLDFMGKDLQQARNGDTAHYVDGASFELNKRIQSVFAAAEKLPEGSMLREQLGEIASKYQNQIENPYYHAGRTGEYFTKIGFKDMDQATWDRMKTALAGTNKVLGDFENQNHAFFRVETADQAQGLRRKLEAAGGDKIVISESAHGKLAEAGHISNNAGISSALRSALAAMHDNVEANGGLQGQDIINMKEAMTRKFLSMLPESSSKLATMKRMGVPGYDGDFLGSFAKRAAGAVQDTASIYSMRGYTQAFKGMGDAVSQMARDGNTEMQTRAQMAHDEIAKRYSNSMKPMDSSHVNLINSLGHSFYLALSPAFFIRTMAQPFHRALPILGSRYGFVSAAKEIGSATGTALKIMGNTIKQGWEEGGARGVLDAKMSFKDMGLNEREEAFVQDLHDRGALNLGQAQQLQRMTTSGSQRMQDLSKFASMTAQYAEMTNRLSTGLAAFRLAEKGNRGRETNSMQANTEYAIRAIDYSMDNFDPSNTARAIGRHGFAGKVTPLMTAFMNYNLQTMQQIARTVHDGVFNRDQSPEGLIRSKEAKKEFAGLMGTSMMISGAMGLPFVSAFAGVYNMLTKDSDNPSDIRLDARNFLADTFGAKAGDIISHGVGSALGVDTSTFGLQSVLPGSEFLASRRLLKDRLAETSQGLMGPALNAGMDIMLALDKISEGHYVKGIAQALPSGLKGYWKAAEMASVGYTDAKGNPIGVKATPWDIAVQSVGLRPEDRAVQAEASNYFNTNQELLNHRKQLITDNIYKAVTRGDADDKKAAFAEMAEFNKKNPTAPIQNVQSIFRQHAIALSLANSTGTGVNANIRNLPQLQKQIRFVDRTAMPR